MSEYPKVFCTNIRFKPAGSVTELGDVSEDEDVLELNDGFILQLVRWSILYWSKETPEVGGNAKRPQAMILDSPSPEVTFLDVLHILRLRLCRGNKVVNWGCAFRIVVLSQILHHQCLSKNFDPSDLVFHRLITSLRDGSGVIGTIRHHHYLCLFYIISPLVFFLLFLILLPCSNKHPFESAHSTFLVSLVRKPSQFKFPLEVLLARCRLFSEE